MNYHNITYPDMNNGSGLRVVLWCSACSHHCVGCQNPQTWDANSGIPFDEKAKEELFRELDKDYISGLTLSGGDPLHETNLDTILDIVTEFNKRYRTTQDMVPNEDNNHNMLNENSHGFRLLLPEKTIWLYTGYTWEDIMYSKMPHPSHHSSNEFLHWNQRKEVVSNVDVLIDGRYIDSRRNVAAKWRGSDNQRVIDVQKSLKQGEIILWNN